MRKDINLNTHTHDIVLKNHPEPHIYRFEYLPETDTCIRAKLYLPSSYETPDLNIDGIVMSIPYIPIFKPMKLLIIYEDIGDEYKDAILSEDDDFPLLLENGNYFQLEETPWMDIKINRDGAMQNINASEFIQVNSNFQYLLKREQDCLSIWSGENMDLQNVFADVQNKNLLLQCIPSNSYRYPISGVGLVRYLHSNTLNTDLSSKLESEFRADGLLVKGARFDPETGELDLNLEHLNEQAL